MKSRRSKRSKRGQDKPAKEAPKFPSTAMQRFSSSSCIASGSGVFTSSFGIKRSEYCITDGRGVAGPGQGGSAFETVLDQHCSEMSTKSWQKPKRPSKSQDGKATAKENSALKDADAIARNGTQTAATGTTCNIGSTRLCAATPSTCQARMLQVVRRNPEKGIDAW